MARKFMREKRVVLSILTVAIITSQLAGCAIISQKNLVDMANESPTVEIEIAEPVPDDETIKEMQKYMDNYTEDDIKDIAKHKISEEQYIEDMRDLEESKSTEAAEILETNEEEGTVTFKTQDGDIGVVEKPDVEADTRTDEEFLEDLMKIIDSAPESQKEDTKPSTPSTETPKTETPSTPSNNSQPQNKPITDNNQTAPIDPEIQKILDSMGATSEDGNVLEGEGSVGNTDWDGVSFGSN